MNRLVYLFELDTAKNSRNDVENAEFAIFNEIIKNGNKVVMSMNQFVDSRVMAAAMYDEESYKYVRRLFDEGALKVSLYADVCSVSQYVQSAIDKCLAKPRDGYIFTTLPIECRDAEMLNEVKSALKYSDLANINKKIDAEYVKLRYENSAENKTEIFENIRKFKIIQRFLALVLKLSVSAKGNNPAKVTEGLGFMEFIDHARSILSTESFRRRDINACKEKVVERLNGALVYFEAEGLSKKQIDRRTTWLKYLTAGGREDIVNELCVEIVNLCYNYAVQDTIQGAAKQYDDYDFENTFKYDFVRRVNLYWSMHSRAAVAKTRAEDTECRLYYPKQWKRAAAICGYNSDLHTVETPATDDNPNERKSWYALIWKKLGITLAYSAAYVLAFCLVLLLGGLMGLPAVGSVFFNLLGIIVIIAASVVLSALIKFPSVFACARGIARHVSNVYSATAKNYDMRERK